MIIKEIQTHNRTANNNKDFGDLTDGDHTINNLYIHRVLLFAALLKDNPLGWKSKLHYDGTMYDDYFITGITLPNTDGPITYHCPLKYWDLFKVKILDRAPEWDSATSEDTLKRLDQYINHIL